VTVPPPAPMAADLFSEAEIETYLEYVAAGHSHDVCARMIGTTGTVMRRLRRRDPVLAERYVQAREDGQGAYQEHLRKQARRRALSRLNPSDRMLEVELATHVPEYRHLRRDRIRHEGNVRHEHAIVFDPSRLEELTDDQLLALRESLSVLGGEIVEGEHSEIHDAA
jgi:hypothetical protein